MSEPTQIPGPDPKQPADLPVSEPDPAERALPPEPAKVMVPLAPPFPPFPPVAVKELEKDPFPVMTAA